MKKVLVLGIIALLAMSIFGFASAEQAKPVILVVSFGTSYNDSREITIGAIEEQIRSAFPDYEVRRAFTSQIIIDKLAERDGLVIDNVKQAMERLVADGVKEVYIQPTQVIRGYEYDDVIAEASAFKDQFGTFAIGAPLLNMIEDYERVADALLKDNEYVGQKDTAIVYMGHGSTHPYNAAYSQIVGVMHSKGYENVFIGTVESFPTVDDVIAQVDAFGAKKVVLYPFMVVAGDHANNDMAGDEADSWNQLFTKAGFEVESKIQGMGENAAIRAIYGDHLRAAIQGAGE